MMGLRVLGVALPWFALTMLASSLSGANATVSDDRVSKVLEYNLRKRKQKGLFHKREVSLSSVLFPGASPNEYGKYVDIPMWITEVNSKKTQLPFDYYSLPVCPPQNAAIKDRHHRKNIGERLEGHSYYRSAPYNIKMNENLSCQMICQVEFDQKKINRMIKLIQRQYNVQLTLDSLPVYVKDTVYGVAMRGYPLGSKLADKSGDVTYYIHNHLHFTISYNADESDGYRVVGFRVKPVSIEHDTDEEVPPSCGPESSKLINSIDTLLPLKIPEGEEYLKVLYTYEVEWEASLTAWADRWDIYLLGRPDDSLAHHMSIINSFMVVIFLSTIVTVILIKGLRRDIALYNEITDIGEEVEETGWKLVHGDVFRPPSTSPMALSVCVGTGAQIATSVIITLMLGSTRLLNPMRKGQTISYIIMLYVFSGAIAGYVSARIYKFCGGKDWKLNTIYTAVAFPGVCMTIFLMLNIFLAVAGAATSVSFWVIILVFFLWACVASPLVFFGSFFGFKKDAIEVPTRVNQIARVVPPQHWSFETHFLTVLNGGMPFSTICIEVYFIMGAIWLHQFFYLVGYLLVGSILLGVTCALMSTVMCYIRLCAEDHRWWWKAYSDSATAGLWFFIYTIWYLCTRLSLVGILPLVVYVSYMFMVSLAFSLFCGSIGFLTSFWFTKTIYGAVKTD